MRASGMIDITYLTELCYVLVGRVQEDGVGDSMHRWCPLSGICDLFFLKGENCKIILLTSLLSAGLKAKRMKLSD